MILLSNNLFHAKQKKQSANHESNEKICWKFLTRMAQCPYGMKNVIKPMLFQQFLPVWYPYVPVWYPYGTRMARKTV